jgi:protoporphyrinogen oxidase
MDTPTILIIGGGPCGLGAAWRLHELGYENYTLLEAGASVGGLASTIHDDNGFFWDIGGHVIHSHYPYFDAMFESVMHGEYLTHQRDASVWMHDRWIPYPFQNNIHRLPQEIRDYCLSELVRSRGNTHTHPPKTFYEWMEMSYGKGMMEVFLLPYNQKVWAYDAKKMSASWVGDRVAPIDIERIREHIRLQTDDVSWGPNAVFRFPLHGGTGDLWRRVADQVHTHIQTHKHVISIDVKQKNVRAADGEQYPYDVLCSTLPLTHLPSLISETTDIPDVSGLHASAVSIIGIGIRGTVPSHLAKKCWMYFPQSDIPFFRATVFSNYSPYNAPAGTWSLMMEIASSAYAPLPPGDLIDACIYGAKKSQLITEDDSIIDRFLFTAHMGYPTPTIDRDAIVNPAIDYYQKKSIYPRGRFGLWKYELSNQDHVFMQGVEWVNSLLFETPETVISHVL